MLDTDANVREQVIYRDIARALRYQRLAEFREELSMLHSLPLYGRPRSH